MRPVILTVLFDDRLIGSRFFEDQSIVFGSDLNVIENRGIVYTVEDIGRVGYGIIIETDIDKRASGILDKSKTSTF